MIKPSEVPVPDKPPLAIDAEKLVSEFRKYVLAVKHHRLNELVGPSRFLRSMGFPVTWRPTPSERNGGTRR